MLRSDERMTRIHGALPTSIAMQGIPEKQKRKMPKLCAQAGAKLYFIYIHILCVIRVGWLHKPNRVSMATQRHSLSLSSMAHTPCGRRSSNDKRHTHLHRKWRTFICVCFFGVAESEPGPRLLNTGSTVNTNFGQYK